MKKLFLLFLTLVTLNVTAQDSPSWKPQLKKFLKFSTFYGAVNGGTSLSNVDEKRLKHILLPPSTQPPQTNPRYDRLHSKLRHKASGASDLIWTE